MKHGEKIAGIGGILFGGFLMFQQLTSTNPYDAGLWLGLVIFIAGLVTFNNKN